MESRRTFLKKSALTAAVAALPAVSSCVTISTIKASEPMKSKDIKTDRNTILPDHNTYKKVRDFAGFIKSEVEKGNTSEFNLIKKRG